MSYTPTEWKTGDVITAKKLNNMESGIVDARDLFVINATNMADSSNPSTTPTLDKTYAEIEAAYNSGMIPIILYKVGTAPNEVSNTLWFSYAVNSTNGLTIIFNKTDVSFNNYNAAAVNETVAVTQTMTTSTWQTKQLSYAAG